MELDLSEGGLHTAQRSLECQRMCEPDKETPLQQPDMPPSPTPEPGSGQETLKPITSELQCFKEPEDASVLCLYLISAHVLQRNAKSPRISQPEPNAKIQTAESNPAAAPTSKKVPTRPTRTLPDTPGSKHNTNTAAQHNHLQTTMQPPMGTYHNHPLFITS